jgi:endonuclease YncB( thermonuclease family)
MKKASLVGAFFVSVIFASFAQALCPVERALPQVAVSRVVDGDTLRLADGRSVRLIGVNAPERGRDGRPAEPFAEAARRRLQALVADNDNRVGLRVGRQGKDHYGRVLAHVYDEHGHNLEARLLEDGLGYWVAFEPETALADCQRAAENQARRSREGLWRQPTILAAERLKKGGFALVRGEIRAVQRNRGGLWLEMGDSLVLRVEPKLLGAFDLPHLRGLAGKRVEVRGWVVDRARGSSMRRGQARWMIDLTYAGMLEELP